MSDEAKEMPKREKYLSVQEVAQILGLEPRSIQRYCEQGFFAGAFKTSEGPTSKWRIPESGYEAYLKTRQKAQRDQTEI